MVRNARTFERHLKKLIAESRYRKKRVAVTGDADRSKSFA